MNNIEILEELINGAKEFNQYNGNKYYKAIENLIQENKELKEKINKIKDLCDTKPYVAYTLYGDLLHESDDILEILKEGDK